MPGRLAPDDMTGPMGFRLRSSPKLQVFLGPPMARPPIAPVIRRHIQVRGVVQGVGFRPFVYKLARSLGLTGYVFNSSSGVTIEIEGVEEELNTFLEALKGEPPELADITGIAVSEIEIRGGAEFSILQSREHLTSAVL